MSKKVILEMSVYTDGDWVFDESLFKNYTSKYFDNDLYEYTVITYYGCKIRRTFEGIDNGFTQVINILTQFSDSIDGRDEYTTNYLKTFFNKQIENANSQLEFYDDIDGNTEIEVEVSIIENDSKPIKKIIFV